ncbi:MAG: hypothetical protein WA137_10445 [Methanothrix sp.]
MENGQAAPLHSKLLTELQEITGNLLGFEQTARDHLAVQIGTGCFLLPISLRDRLEEMRGKRIGATLIRGKHYIRQMPQSASSSEDLLRARVAELEAENERLRAAQRGLDEGRGRQCTR